MTLMEKIGYGGMLLGKGVSYLAAAGISLYLFLSFVHYFFTPVSEGLEVVYVASVWSAGATAVLFFGGMLMVSLNKKLETKRSSRKTTKKVAEAKEFLADFKKRIHFVEVEGKQYAVQTGEEIAGGGNKYIIHEVGKELEEEIATFSLMSDRFVEREAVKTIERTLAR